MHNYQKIDLEQKLMNSLLPAEQLMSYVAIMVILATLTQILSHVLKTSYAHSKLQETNASYQPILKTSIKHQTEIIYY